MVKPVEMSQLMDRVRDSARQMEGVCEEPPELPPPPSPNVDDRMSNIFLSLGIPAHIKGYQFLREGVRLVIEQPDRINPHHQGAISQHCAALCHQPQQGGARHPPRH